MKNRISYYLILIIICLLLIPSMITAAALPEENIISYPIDLEPSNSEIPFPL